MSLNSGINENICQHKNATFFNSHILPLVVNWIVLASSLLSRYVWLLYNSLQVWYRFHRDPRGWMLSSNDAIVFHKLDENANMLTFLSLLCETKKIIQWQNITLGGDRTRASHNLWFKVQHYPFWMNWHMLVRLTS